MMVARRCHCVMRCPRQSFTEVKAVWAAPDPERVVTREMTAKVRAYVAQPQLPTTVRVRLVKGLLASGDGEVLGTDLRDAQTYPAAEFKAVYGWRWQQETSQDRSKDIFEVERFSGTRVQAITPDFSGVIFLATWESMLSKPAQAVLPSQGEARACRSAPQVNRAVSYVTVLDQIVQLWGDTQRSPASTLATLERLVLTTPTRPRPGRQVPRHKRSAAHRLRFAKYGKRVVA